MGSVGRRARSRSSAPWPIGTSWIDSVSANDRVRFPDTALLARRIRHGRTVDSGVGGGPEGVGEEGGVVALGAVVQVAGGGLDMGVAHPRWTWTSEALLTAMDPKKWRSE
jgi:hypothetical protein